MSAQNIRYVKATATGASNGTSCQDASGDLQAMINESDESNGDMIFVAAGTYRPSTASFPVPFNRENAFRVQKNIKIFGGFPADGGDSTQRDWIRHQTILSGDLYQNDQHGAEFNDDNSYHVLVTDGSSVNSDCVIDGFTLTGGNADHPSANYYQNGGGWYNGTSSPTVINLTITGNNAQFGGGWRNVSGSPVVANIEIRGNRARMGGGLHIGEGNPRIKNVRIWDNHAQINGGGIYITYISGLLLENVSIRGNTAERGGAVYQFDGSSVFLSSEITGNVAQRGAGVYSVTANVTIVNCTIAGNAAEYEIMWVSNAFVTIFNSIFFHNASPSTFNPFSQFSLENSLVENQTYEDGLGNLSGILNPAFVYPVIAAYSSDPDFSKATSQGDFNLLPCSPVIDKGKNSALPPTWNTDLAGNNRTTNWIVDLGAFEYQSNGTSLAQAVQMSNACEGLETILVAKGTYFPEQKITNRRDDRDKAFTFTAKKVTVLGGYPSGGGPDRDWVANKTILSGDIDGNGVLDNGNSFHVVVFGQQPFEAQVTLDGLIVEGGNANEASFDLVPLWSSMIYNNQGGGGYSYNSFARLNNVIVRDNFAEEGGGWYHNLGGISIYNSVISANQAAHYGGGVYVNAGWMGPYNVTISGNSAGYSGGGWYTKWTNQLMVNCILTGNSAAQSNPDYYGTDGEDLVQSIVGNKLYTPPGLVTDLEDGSILNPYTLRLVEGSPAINTGSAFDGMYDFHLDMGGNNRRIDNYIDIGAFEYDPNESLPVILIDFKVVRVENQTLLTWNTTSEVNVSHFEIERSFDAKSWGVVGVQNAKSRENGTAGIWNYSHKDIMTAVSANFSETVYYRLRMVDEDQTFSYSGIQSVLVETIGDDAIFSVYPNPTLSGLIQVDVGASQTAQLRIFDLIGREVGTTRVFEGSIPVDLSRLPKGVYLLHIRGTAVSVVKKVVVE